MSILTHSQTELDSSLSSLRRPRKSKSSSSSEVSKVYKHTSQLYLTRRLAECYEALQPVIRPPSKPDQANGNHSASEDDSNPRAPIALASTSQRIKIWSLYAALLNVIIELGDEEGKRDFGSKQYREIVRNVQSGEVWEQVVRDGYLGRESSVDAEVVYNLSNLLLQKAQDQAVNQARLETYLSSSPSASIDLSAVSNSLESNDAANSFHGNGLDTPKDLNSRIKILELFTLHVLPRNNEWDYARSFIANSDILDEERRDAFAQTLTELQEAAEAQTQTEDEDLVGFAEETDPEEDDEKIRMNEDDNEEAVHSNGHGRSENRTQQPDRPRKSRHQRTSSEVDYGIDDDFLKSHIQNQQRLQQEQRATETEVESTATTKATSVSQRTLSPTPSVPPPSTSSAPSRPSTSPPAAQATRKPQSQPSTAPASTRRPPQPTNGANKRDTNRNNKNNTQKSGLSKLLLILSNLTSTIVTSLTRNPTQVFRTLMFLVALLAVLARRDVRDRLRRMLAGGWAKVSQTAGMGVRVSYV
ncbi:hypothetical protein LTR70_003162 [Exophiala xenobiotica]|uniref:Peroxin 26 n=1 Tax=Lithohypha guttulata TaxID=1690604 RepID=A0ABR0KGS8_9EURO|nr:hypothetical protein LTR24_002807 [Lithohypha guttulata]KAK5323674.1 hypothetical protein LTR70_003162 [Exophiala xenobiotica]